MACRSLRSLLRGLFLALSLIVSCQAKPDNVESRRLQDPEYLASRYEDLVELLVGAGISTLDDLTDDQSNSPQFQAAIWMVLDDARQVDFDRPEKVVQRYILATAFYALEGVGFWGNRLNFLSADHECKWYVSGYYFGRDNLQQFGVKCNNVGKVQALHFPSNYLRGQFPMDLAHLTDLEEFNVFNNPYLRSGFPSFFEGMANIKYIGLHYCDLEGTLPTWLGELTSLESLMLSNDLFTGPLPNMTNLVNLTHLYLDDNLLLGDLSVLSGLSNLRHLILEDNQFEGSLDESLVGSWENLEIFDVSGNNLTSSIPESIFTLPKLWVADLNGNLLSGTLPAVSEANTALEILTLGGNNLSGEVPSELGQFISMKQLDLSDNLLTSTIPSSLVNMVDLEFLYINQNPLAPDPIPDFLAEMTNLKELSLKDTARTGSIPHMIGNWGSMVFLDLDNNGLTGNIPASLGILTALQYLFLNRNELSGFVPSSLESLSNLAYFFIDQNNIIGSLDEIICGIDYQDIFVADCGGVAPDVTCYCCNICCSDADTGCNNQIWTSVVNPIWELGFELPGPQNTEGSQSYTISGFFGEPLP
ncbi:leucine Rich Repeat [Seminavis robusta]|uniref:Leucine Rich Repeat n=1 Tax=Seminavis robusta TaxID=568900 RepID=A0A9N8DKF4_9STRA|nr:leucine Rich Repeat [Seminavis robusta]|eukprot:Sro132_g062610.1 leucine Rich Repeat (588) ;mRNA; f:59009-61049